MHRSLKNLVELREILFPMHCFGCNTLGINICSKCRRFWNPHFYIQEIDGLAVYSSIRYSPVARSILLSAKENSVKLADELIIDALFDCLKRLPSHLLRDSVLMPIPGSKRAIRKRGRDFILDLTNELSLRSGLKCVPGMRVSRRLLDQSGLSSVDRSRNIKGAFEYLHKSIIEGDPREQFKSVILVDDLVTTGSTLLEAKRALNSVGISNVRAITACMAQTLNIGG